DARRPRGQGGRLAGRRHAARLRAGVGRVRPSQVKMATLERTEQSADVPPAPRMPPGPKLPRFIQTLGFMVPGPRFIDACRRRYGDVVTLSTVFDEQFVMVFDPALVKELFQ